MFDPFSLIIQLIVFAVTSIASTLLKQAFAPKTQEQQRATGTRGSAQVGGKVPQYFLVGTVGEPGKFEYGNEWGNSGEVPNAYAVDVYSFGDLPITAMTRLYVGGVAEPVSGSGHVEQGFPTAGDKAGKLWVEFFDGTQTSANSYLTSKFGSDADRPWLSDMIGRGVPYVTTTALWDENKWTGFPSFVAEFQGIKLYDPRQDSTAGGSGLQRWDTPSTWAFSDNNMVIIYNIERGIYYNGAHVWGGKKTAAEMPYAAWAAAMNACDLVINLVGGGSERQFRAGRRINLNERPGEVIRELLIGCNGRITHCADGTVYPLVGVPAEADGAFTDADVLATNALGTIPFPNLDEVINGATATYREPLQAWEDKETAPYLRSDLEAQDDGRQQIEGLDLGTTFSGTQAQRIIKAVIEEGRRFRTHVVALPPEYAQFRPLQVLAWTSDRFDYSAKLFLITARTVEPFGNVILGLQEIDPADHDWDPETDEQPLSFAPVVTNRPAPQEVSGFSVAPAIALDAAGNSRRPAIDVFWASASVTVDVRAVRITIRLAATDMIIWEGEAPRPELGEARITQALLPNEDYEVQIQYMPFSGRVTVESSWLSVTTPNVKLGPLDVVYGDIDLDELGDQVQGYFDWMGQNIRELIEQAQALSMLAGDQELANAMQFDEMRRNLSVVSGEISASFEETVTVAIVPMQGQLVAMADALTELSASDEGDISTARIRFTAVTGPSGYSRVGIETRFDPADGSDFRLAGSYWDTPNNNSLPTRRMEIAEQFVIAESPAAAAFQPFVFQSGVLRVSNAYIGGLTAANIATRTLTADVIAANTLTSAEINVAQLVASTAFLTYLQVGTANIANLAVGTLQIANGAIADYVSGATPSGSSWVSDAFVPGNYPVTLATNADFMLGSTGSDPDSNLAFELVNLSTSAVTTLAYWTRSSPIPIGISSVVMKLVNGHTYQLRLRPVVGGTGSVTFVGTPVFLATIPKK